VHVDRGSFLILVTTLAAGAAGGYFLSEKHLLPHFDEWGGKPPPKPEPPPAPAIVDASVPEAAPEAAAPAAPACSDEVGTPGPCPPPGFPVFEGGCGSFANQRCGEFKQAMKPRVAQAAVECLNKLSAQERCDPVRVNLCGHVALMNACAEADPLIEEHEPKAGAKPGALATCKTIALSCGKTHVPPSIVECKQALSGLNDNGRGLMIECMKKHCVDRSILGCEAVPAR
jgi:hypothetical protein